MHASVKKLAASLISLKATDVHTISMDKTYILTAAIAF
jgi:hypothetical protein